MSNKKRYLALALAVMFIAGMAAPVCAEESAGATTYAEIKAMFPQADILEDMGNPYEKVVVSRNARAVATDFKYDVAKEDAVPVDVYEIEGYGGFHTLNVYEDGSYVLLSVTKDSSQTRGTELGGWGCDSQDTNYKYYNDIKVKQSSGSSYCQFYVDVTRRVNDPGNDKWWYTSYPYSASSGGSYGVATQDYGRNNNSDPIKAYQAFSTVVYDVIGYDPVSGEAIWGNMTNYWRLQFNISQEPSAKPTVGWGAW